MAWIAPFSMIIRVVFVAVLLAATPVVSLFDGVPPAAWADDDDDDDGEDDDDDDSPIVRRAPALPDFVPGEVLLINPSEAALDRSRGLGFTAYATEVVADGQTTVVRLRPPAGLDAPAALALLRRETPDQLSDLNHLYRLQQAPAPRDPYDCGTSRCYGQTLIGWSGALAACSAGLKIGVLDTGVETAHPSLRGQRITAASFVAPPARPSATQHGTGIVALLAANGKGGVRGLLPQADILAADVFHTAADGSQSADAVTIARGLGWLTSQGVGVINISFAGPENGLVTAAVRSALARDIAIVAAAGNDGPDAPPRHPAAMPEVHAVTAIDPRRRAYRRAARGDHIDYAAPGVNVWTARARGRHGAASGTSYAAPFVSAVFSVLRGDHGAPQKPETLDLGAAGRDAVFGDGLVQAPARCRREVSRN